MTNQTSKYLPPKVNRYVSGMAYDSTVHMSGVARVVMGALSTSSATTLASATLMVNGSAVTVSFNSTQGIIGGTTAPFGRALQFVASNTNTRTATVTGVDYLGQPMVEVITLTSATIALGKKAFYKVDSIVYASASDTTTVNAGVINRFGLPHATIKGLAEIVDGVVSPMYSDPVCIPFEIEQTQLLAPTNEALVSPTAGYISRLTTVVQSAVTTGGDITVLVNATTVVGLTCTVADGATAGTCVTDTPTDVYGITGKINANGASSTNIFIAPGAPFATAGEVNGFLEILPQGVIPRTNTQSTTAYDPRGLYEPLTTPDSTKVFELLVVVDTNNASGYYGTAHVVA